MPKIIIREIDNTKAGYEEYENFAVVVPGFCGTPEVYKEDIFDTNGIYECSSQSEFVKYIGKFNPAGSYAICETLTHAVTKDEFDGIYKNQCYLGTEITEEAKKIPGRLVKYDSTAKKWYTLAIVSEFIEEEATNYVVVLFGNEGYASQSHLGNQITYELLGLGYTVLFKKLDEVTNWGTTSKPITGISALTVSEFWECLKDKSNYDFRYITTGGYHSATVYKYIIDVATSNNKEALEDVGLNGRGDCIALLDIDESSITAKEEVNGIRKYINNTLVTEGKVALNKYSALFCPTVTYDDEDDADYGNNHTFPASFHYLVCAANSIGNLNYAEWYAIAGYNRGVSSKTIKSLSLKLGEIAINALQPRVIVGDTGTSSYDYTKYSVNLITNIRGSYYLWGNRTAHALQDAGLTNAGLVASHFLNIRQLCCTLKKDIWNACKAKTFDPNSDILWGEFCNAIKPTLDKMKADQGIEDYKIIKVKSAKKALLTAKIRIVPIEAVEDFDISIYLEDSISGISVNADEE